MGMQWAEHTIEIEATPEQVFDAITDYETFPGWQSAVLATDVRETDSKTKLGELVYYEVDGKIRTIRYTLRYHYDRPEKIWWDFVEGHGINQMDGGYEIKPSGSGTAATYKVGVEVSGIPGPILKRTQKATVRKANEDLKAEAERRAGAEAGAPAAERPAGHWEPAGAKVAAPERRDEDHESVTDAAVEAAEALGKLAAVAAARAIKVARGVADGVSRRLLG